MPRLMSMALTVEPVIARAKTVTRRRGWLMLTPGTPLILCRQVQGLRPGERVDRLAEVVVVSVRRERLDEITAEEVALEGYPGLSPEEFVRRFFVEAQRMRPDDLVTRIEWRYTDQAVAGLGL